MIVDYSLEYFQGILFQVSKWRAIPLNALYKMSGYPGTRTSFYRVIRKLEERNLLRATNFNGKAKIITPTKDLADLNSSRHIDLQEESINHEAIVTILCCELLKWEIFESVTLPHEVVSRGLDSGIRRLPDAVIEGRHKDRPFKLALEVEITRKSKTRVKNKIEDYLNNDVFDFVLYVFNNKFVFDAYKRFFEETISHHEINKTRKHHQSRFILGNGPLLIGKMCKLDDFEIFYMGEKTFLTSIFGKKRDDT